MENCLPPTKWVFPNKYVLRTQEHLQHPCYEVRRLQLQVRQGDKRKPLPLAAGNMVWHHNKHRRKRITPNCNPTFVVSGIYETYLLD